MVLSNVADSMFGLVFVANSVDIFYEFELFVLLIL